MCNKEATFGRMNASQPPRNVVTCLTDTPSEFHIVILYEDGDSGRRGKRISDKLLLESGGEGGCSRQLWSFDVLAISDVAEAAATAAGQADLLIVSVSGERELPEHVQGWLARWISRIDKKPSLMATFEKTNDREAHRAHLFLQTLAGEKGLVYFPQRDFPPSAESVLEGHALRRLGATGITIDEHDEDIAI